MDQDLLLKAQQALPHLPEAVQQRVGALIAEARRAKAKEAAQNDFMAYVNYVWPSFINGRHHEKMARAFERVVQGQCKRLIYQHATTPHQVRICVLTCYQAGF
jgi:hypothetical protein